MRNKYSPPAGFTEGFPAALVSTHARSNWPRLTLDSPMLLCVRARARVGGVHSNHHAGLRGKFLIWKHVRNIKIMQI